MNLITTIKTEAAIDVHDIKARGHLGDIYEQVLNDLRRAGNAGEFYNPRLPPPSSISKNSSIRTPVRKTGACLALSTRLPLRKWIGSSRSALGRGADRAPSAF
ncbi:MULTISPECIES: hypothetical protein [unclassified Thiocapsa]|uniref:hypothetical protein n=1 Tax=unclassified Thiocapsa TaxID=2641286 RepID=UPI0035AE6B73